MRDTGMLRDVAKRQMHIRKERFGLLVDVPPDDAHLSWITKASALALYRVLLVRSMHEIMARRAECDEIIRATTTRLSRLDMVDIQDGVF